MNDKIFIKVTKINNQSSDINKLRVRAGHADRSAIAHSNIDDILLWLGDNLYNKIILF
jgi:hypothetical protein